MKDTRKIVLHYHLFKNAGTSVDTILKQNFGDAWVAREFPPMNGNNTEAVEGWILETPEAVAYSSHTMMGPLPKVKGVEMISILLLRDPIERIKSAYRFERQQNANTWGAKLAKANDFESYVNARLVRNGDRQCRNFQTHRLACFSTSVLPELDRAKAAVHELSVVGRVERMQEFLRLLEEKLNEHFRDIQVESLWKNKSEDMPLSTESIEDLIENNKDDMAILDYLDEIFFSK